MKVIIPHFQYASVLVVGDLILDRYWYGPTSRISPEAPVPVVKVDTIKERPGGAANVAMNIATLGLHSHLVGLTGIDDSSRVLSAKLSTVNVHCDFVSVPTHPTITKLRVLSRNQQLIRLDFEEGFSNVDAQPLLTRIEQALPGIRIMVLSDYAKGALSQVQNIIKLARAAKLPVLIDPKGSDFERYRGATLLTPNLSEFEEIVGYCKDEADLVKRGMKLIADFTLSALLVTRSGSGMTLLQPKVPPLHLPTQAQEVFDVTGAGDTVIGVLAAALASGHSLEESCFLANAAAGVVVGKLGTASVSPVELETAIRGRL
ncbi:D-beta-D-heptose 7-phosphate kinase (Bifunctional protein HldE) [Serratia symbiotica]|nr:D-beta-D-heptose 7-phosphate kinase (Bifunctional protein HldE) [Serratia symbiotica]